MRQWLLRSAVGLSFLLFAATVLVSVGSNFTHHKLSLLRESARGTVHERTLWAFELAESLRLSRETLVETGLTPEQIEVLRADIAAEPHYEWTNAPGGQDSYDSEADWRRWDGLVEAREVWPAGDWKVSTSIPYRLVEFATGILPALAILRLLIRWRSRRRGVPRPPTLALSVAAVVSFALCILAVLVWAQSEVSGAVCRRVQDVSSSGAALYSTISWVSMPGRCHLILARLSQYPQRTDNSELNTVTWHAPEYDDFNPDCSGALPVPPYKRVQFGSAEIEWSSQNHEWEAELVISYWLLWALTACLPMFWLAIRGGWILRRPPGACGRCGYDLRASTGRCPECGEAIRPHESPRGAGASPVDGAVSPGVLRSQ